MNVSDHIYYSLKQIMKVYTYCTIVNQLAVRTVRVCACMRCILFMLLSHADVNGRLFSCGYLAAYLAINFTVVLAFLYPN